jgi:hypothetical protein
MRKYVYYKARWMNGFVFHSFAARLMEKSKKLRIMSKKQLWAVLK